MLNPSNQVSFEGTDLPSSRAMLAVRLRFFLSRWAMLFRSSAGILGLLIIVGLLIVAVAAPLLVTHDINAQDLKSALQNPSSEHWFGTDNLGRDIYSRVVYGTRITLYITFITAMIVAPVGLVVGTVSGYFGGFVDGLLMRVVDVFLAFPSLILALAFVAALGPGLENAMLAIALASWPPIARLARAETLTIRKADYISAVRLQGASALRIICLHLVPMCLPSVVVRTTLNMSSIILAAAGLGFLGLGAQPPSPEWGAMLASGQAYVLSNAWIAGAPGLAILISSVGFNLLGDTMRDILDPRNG